MRLAVFSGQAQAPQWPGAQNLQGEVFLFWLTMVNDGEWLPDNMIFGDIKPSIAEKNWYIDKYIYIYVCIYIYILVIIEMWLTQ